MVLVYSGLFTLLLNNLFHLHLLGSSCSTLHSEVNENFLKKEDLIYKVYSRTTRSQIGCTVFQVEETSVRTEYLQYLYYIHIPKAKTMPTRVGSMLVLWPASGVHKAKSLKLSWYCPCHLYRANILFVWDHFLYENFPFHGCCDRLFHLWSQPSPFVSHFRVFFFF